jgi:hypothetical protein
MSAMISSRDLHATSQRSKCQTELQHLV